MFRRFAMTFNGLIVGYGLAVVFGSLFGLIEIGYMIWLLVAGINLALLYMFFSRRRGKAPQSEFSSSSSGSGQGPPFKAPASDNK